jgi:hypothetical protein
LAIKYFKPLAKERLEMFHERVKINTSEEREKENKS